MRKNLQLWQKASSVLRTMPVHWMMPPHQLSQYIYIYHSRHRTTTPHLPFPTPPHRFYLVVYLVSHIISDSRFFLPTLMIMLNISRDFLAPRVQSTICCSARRVPSDITVLGIMSSVSFPGEEAVAWDGSWTTARHRRSMCPTKRWEFFLSLERSRVGIWCSCRPSLWTRTWLAIVDFLINPLAGKSRLGWFQ